MALYTNYGDLQQELDSCYRENGKRLQFVEVVDSLYQKGKLVDAPPSFEGKANYFSATEPAAFSAIVDQIYVPVKTGIGLREQVNEDDIIPMLRDIFIIRHLRYTRPYLHKHNYVELDYVVEGHCLFHSEQEEQTMYAGELCVIAPGLNHDIEITDESTVYCIMLRRSIFESSFFSLLLRNEAFSLFFRTTLGEKSRPNYIMFRADDQALTRTVLQAAMIESYMADHYSNTCCISLINLFLANILRSSGETPLPNRKRSGTDFAPVLRYIEQHYSDLTLADLAGQFHYSKPYLCTIVKQNTGVSFTDLMKRIRMNHAVDYLLNTSQSIGKIAEIVGYHSTDHFSRVFRATYGISPQEYRRKNKHDEDRFIPFEMSK